MPAISPARRTAFDILLAIERGRGHSDELLRGASTNALSAADRNLATALVLGVLRWQIHLDHAIRPLLKRPTAKLDSEVLIALRLGAFQLHFFDRVPAHAAINESVELTKHAGHRFASGMVNAVLRSAARATVQTSDSPLPSSKSLPCAAAHPLWMVERWEKFYGLESASAICQHGQEQPQVSVRLTSSDLEAELVQAGIVLEPGHLLTNARTVVSGDVTVTEAFRTGRVRIQDEGSQLIGELAARSGENLLQNQEKILDACAAPGGKTLILAERNPQAQIVACESNPKRLADLRERLASLGGRIECRLTDAADLTEESLYDAVLADVPCSGTGTLGRNPEIRHRLQPGDLPRQAERQRAILHAAIRAAKAGGQVVYSTCSLEPEENEEVVAAVLAETPEARQISPAPRIQSLLESGILTPAGSDRLRECLTPDGALRLLPGALPTDGFFVALIQKAS
ncbi:MAG: 16S rRNA (cytosine(967)-C(5))-methyltransferase RsmB [Terracidiphilus sp.]